MKTNKPVKIGVAETSPIIRAGLISILKGMSELNIYPIEIASRDILDKTIRMHAPDILIVNPSFEGWFDVNAFKESAGLPGIKCISLVCTILDSSLLKNYDESFSLYDDINTLTEKITKLRKGSQDKEDFASGQEPLSQREKEIIKYVVKGMTNKAIAENLYLSIHTVITHRRNIARKLQIHSPAGLTIYAIVNKLVELKDVEGRL